MAFRLRNQKDIDKKTRSDQTKSRNNRGQALTEDTEGFQDLYWS